MKIESLNEKFCSVRSLLTKCNVSLHVTHYRCCKLFIEILEIRIATTLAKLGLATALKLSPVGRGYELDGWPTANIVVKVHTLFFLFFFFFFAYCVVIVNSVLKSRFSIISGSGFRKRQKQRTNKILLVSILQMVQFLLPIVASKKIILTVNLPLLANSIDRILLKRRQSVFPLFVGFVCSVTVVFCC